MKVQGPLAKGDESGSGWIGIGVEHAVRMLLYASPGAKGAPHLSRAVPASWPRGQTARRAGWGRMLLAPGHPRPPRRTIPTHHPTSRQGCSWPALLDQQSWLRTKTLWISTASIISSYRRYFGLYKYSSGATSLISFNGLTFTTDYK